MTRVNSVQQNVQQQRRATARMHNRRHHWLPAKLIRTWHVPVVCIQMIIPRQRARCVPDWGVNTSTRRLLTDNRGWPLTCGALVTET